MAGETRKLLRRSQQKCIPFHFYDIYDISFRQIFMTGGIHECHDRTRQVELGGIQYSRLVQRA